LTGSDTTLPQTPANKDIDIWIKDTEIREKRAPEKTEEHGEEAQEKAMEIIC